MLAQVTRRLARYVMYRYSGFVNVAYFRSVTHHLARYAMYREILYSA
jgi:hypothetical protein